MATEPNQKPKGHEDIKPAGFCLWPVILAGKENNFPVMICSSKIHTATWYLMIF